MYTRTLNFGCYSYRSSATFRVQAVQGPAMLLALWKEGHPVQKVAAFPSWSSPSFPGHAQQKMIRTLCLGRQDCSKRCADARFQLQARWQRDSDVSSSSFDCGGQSFSENVGNVASLLENWTDDAEAPNYAVLRCVRRVQVTSLRDDFWSTFTPPRFFLF